MNCNLRKHSENRFCCGLCHRAFSAMAVFDWHRRGGTCSDPAGGGFVAKTVPGAVGDVILWGVGGENPWLRPHGDDLESTYSSDR